MSTLKTYRNGAPLPQRAGLTLVEMLVAMTCTILLMFAITQTFQSIGEVSAKGRAAIEISTQLRGVQHRLHKDFESLTVPVRPWPEAGAGEGYFEINEGTNSYDGQATNSQFDLFGDIDDIWAMTIRSTGEPFVGRYNGNMIQSQLAEVIWFTSFIDKSSPANGTFDAGEPVNLHRRVLLIRPDLNQTNTGQLAGYTDTQLGEFLQNNDVSVHMTGGNLAANSLADLTLRQNRFAHMGAFPSALSVTNGFLTNNPGSPNNSFVLAGDRTGEDVMLSNLLSADIRVFDRTALVKASSDGNTALVPGDPGYTAALANATIGAGTYVDLNYVRYVPAATSEFSGQPQAKSGLTLPIYDTWSYWYEHDGVDQFNDSLVDRAEDGLDNDNTNGVDDVGERETSPPYPVPLRGVQVRIRVLEPETSQVRQATVVQDFIPE